MLISAFSAVELPDEKQARAKFLSNEQKCNRLTGKKLI